MKHISEFVKEHQDLRNYTCFKWDEKSVKAFWDFEAIFDSRYFTHSRGRNIAGLFAAQLKGRRRVLDFGAGKGFLTGHLLDKGFEVSCFELSDESSRALDAKFKDHPRYRGSFSPAGMAERRGTFEVVWLIEVMEHLEDEARRVVLRSIHDLLEPGGVVIVSTPNEEDLLQSLICNPVTREVYHRWQHVYSWTRESLTAELERNGFQTVQAIETDIKYVGRGAWHSLRGWMKGAGSRITGHPQDNLFVVSAKPNPAGQSTR